MIFFVSEEANVLICLFQGHEYISETTFSIKAITFSIDSNSINFPFEYNSLFWIFNISKFKLFVLIFVLIF